MLTIDLTIEELKSITAVLLNTPYKLGDAAIILPISQKLMKFIQESEPKKVDKIITKEE